MRALRCVDIPIKNIVNMNTTLLHSRIVAADSFGCVFYFPAFFEASRAGGSAG